MTFHVRPAEIKNRLPPELIDRQPIPMQNPQEYEHTLLTINETWKSVSKLIDRINRYQTDFEMRQRSFEIAANLKFETMQKEMNLLRGHINRFVRTVEEINDREMKKQAQVTVDELNSESVDQVPANDDANKQIVLRAPLHNLFDRDDA